MFLFKSLYEQLLGHICGKSKMSGRPDNILSPIRTVIVSHMDVCKNKFTHHLSDKTHAFGWRFIHSGGASSVILRTRERAAHVANHMIEKQLPSESGFRRTSDEVLSRHFFHKILRYYCSEEPYSDGNCFSWGRKWFSPYTGGSWWFNCRPNSGCRCCFLSPPPWKSPAELPTVFDKHRGRVVI